MFIKDYMYKDVHTTSPDTTVAEALLYMSQNKTNSLIVVDEQHKPIGIISSQILIRAAVPEYLRDDPMYSQFNAEGALEENVNKIKDKKLKELMYTEFHKLSLEDAIIEAASYSVDSYRRILPVVDEQGVLTGAITRTCIKNAMYDALYGNKVNHTDS